MKNDAVFRHELKYLISKKEMDIAKSRLGEFASSDRHASSGTYSVRSLYYDDGYMSAYEDKMAGVASRRKFRIRIYDMDASFICLEKKIKEGEFVRKESAVLTMDEYGMIKDGDTGFLLKRPETAAKELAVEERMNALHPVAIVDYDRIPFVYEHGNVRITFDMNIRAKKAADVFDTIAPSYDVLGTDLLIMEVKYTEFLPDIFRAVLPDECCRMASSKYVMSVDVLRRNFAI